jgi:hypothetical protein
MASSNETMSEDSRHEAPFLLSLIYGQLIYDYDGGRIISAGATSGHQSASSASGSRQLDAPQLAARLGGSSGSAIRRLHVSTAGMHIFHLASLNTNVCAEGRAVSCYADRDLSMSASLASGSWPMKRVPGSGATRHDESTLYPLRAVDGNATPSVTDITVRGGATEMTVVAVIGSQFSFPTTCHASRP